MYRGTAIALSFFLLLGCSEPPKKLHDFLREYAADSARFGIHFDVDDYHYIFTDLEGTVVGLCFPGTRDIQIDHDFWERSSDCKRTTVLYHELGHCHLRQDHRDQSLMQSYVPLDFCERREEYVAELFTHGQDFTIRKGVLYNESIK